MKRMVAWVWAVLLVACGVRLVALPLVNHAGVHAHDAKEYAAAVAWFDRNDVVNPLVRWVAPYNRGVAHFGDRDWPAAADAFRRALDLAPAGERCRVALNLVWTLEAQGDDLRANGDQDGARAVWDEAKQALWRAQCPKPTPPDQPRPPEQPDQQDQQQQTQQAAGETADRLDRKQQESSRPDTKPQPEAERQRNQLKERQEQAQRSAQQGRDARDRAPGGPAQPKW